MQKKLFIYVLIIVIIALTVFNVKSNHESIRTQKDLGRTVLIEHQKVIGLLYRDYIAAMLELEDYKEVLYKAKGFTDSLQYSKYYIHSKGILADLEHTIKIVEENIDKNSNVLIDREELEILLERNLSRLQKLYPDDGSSYEDPLTWYMYYTGKRSILTELLK